MNQKAHKQGLFVLVTYTILDVEVSPIHNQESDHLVTVQPHSVMQRGISFLEKPRPQAKVGPEARKCVPQEPGLGSDSR